MLAVNAKNSLRVQIATRRDHEALPAGRNGRSLHFGKRAVGQAIENSDAI